MVYDHNRLLVEQTDKLPKSMLLPFKREFSLQFLPEYEDEIAEEVDRIFNSETANTGSFHEGTRSREQILRSVMKGKLGEIHFTEHTKGALVRATPDAVRKYCPKNPFFDRLLVRNGPKSLLNCQYQDRINKNTGDIFEFKVWDRFFVRNYRSKGWQKQLEHIKKREMLFASFLVIYAVNDDGTLQLDAVYKTKDLL